ncbi:MAG TPA: efflux RND transporter periplasmic adaptor subunit [Gemmataceae bacterium]|nr:efflux RND transporter periplasmic adaptor subunit [Gemmataceae bacterium]
MNWIPFRPAALVALAAVGCSKPPAGRPEPPPAPVTVTTAVKRTVPVQVRAIGSVKVVSTVAIRSRVGGALTEIHFKEGDTVKKGQRLFTIDPRPYEATVKQAEATLAKDAAVLRGAELALFRAEQGAGGAVTASEIDIARTAVASAKATVDADAAALAAAKLQLSYTSIASPLDGRAGEILVTAGNLIDANGTAPLVVVNQITPIFVTFAVPESRFPAIKAARERGPVKVEASARDGESPIPGTLAFIDNTVNPTSGTIQLKAEFPNPDGKLWPGQFVDVVLTVGDRPDSVVVPATAVQSGQQGTYVFVVTAETKAALKPVTVAFEADGQAILAGGLEGGETVVLDGQLRLVNGTKVEVKKAP